MEAGISELWDRAGFDFVRARSIAVMASATDGLPLACTIFYVLDPQGRLIFKSRSGSDHMRAIATNPSVSIAIYDHESTYLAKSGIQLKGEVVRITDEIVMRQSLELYSHRFDGARARFEPIEDLLAPDAVSTLFAVEIRALKFLDPANDRADHDYGYPA